ncbi:MAG TPA: beta-galactosidase [Terriglobales bacterium]|nr:beta-galactosidase [Terriglobales bacterium]
MSALAEAPSSPIVIDARNAAPPPTPLPFPVGGTSPTGHVLGANNRYLTMDGKPWFPVMGEFHYSRYPDTQWEKELLKTKAGGIQVISTYVFWIHHEEVEGEFNWSGQRDLRRFVQLCAKHGLYVWVRIGPWDHGEVRNGGLPDWVLKKTATRENNPVYLGYVRRFYGEIGKQTQGLFWKDGGPIIGVQLENEYSARGPGKGAEHIFELRHIAREAGLDAPFYTVTGWDNAVIPTRDVLPVFSGYADGFWWPSRTELPPNPNYFFTLTRCQENIGDDLRSKHPEIDAVDAHYPYLTAEMGAGMASSYHRRPVLSADDTAAMAVVKLGSGVTAYGYYMFHGGTNPEGAKTTLQESRATGYPNDLPVKSYDFAAPLGEFGQEGPSYRVLKMLDLFMGDFGEALAPMTPYFPKVRPKGIIDTATARVAARLRDDRGFLFLNNHERARHLPERRNFQVEIKMRSGDLKVPRTPISIPSDAYAIWPVNLDLGGIVLRYATAQPLCKLGDPATYVFFALPGIAPQLAFENKKDVVVENFSGEITREQNTTYVHGIEPGPKIAVQVRSNNGRQIEILVLTQEEALNMWKSKLRGKERLVLSRASLYFDGGEVYLAAHDGSAMKAAFYPALGDSPAGFNREDDDGAFQVLGAPVSPLLIRANIEEKRGASALPPPQASREVAQLPGASAFEAAARWAIDVPRETARACDGLLLEIAYEGDIARLYAGERLVSDNFYNGTPWLVGMDRISANEWSKLELRILPLHEHAPIYVPTGAWPAIPRGGQVADVKGLQILPEYELVMSLEP